MIALDSPTIGHRRWIGLACTLLMLGAMVFASGCSPAADAQPVAVEPSSPYVAVARGRVDVEGGLLKVGPVLTGTVAEVNVKPGDTVKKGQILARLEQGQAKLNLASAEAALGEARAKAKLTEVRRAAAAAQAKRLSDAAKAGVVQGQSVDEAQAASAALVAESGIDQASIKRAEQDVERARYAMAQLRIVAPANAEVAEVAVHSGEQVAPSGEPLFVLLPEGPRIVRAELNESYADAVHPGMEADVVFGNGTITLRAHVLRVASMYHASRLPDDTVRPGQGRAVESILALGASQPVRIGQRVTVHFLPSTSPAQGRE